METKPMAWYEHSPVNALEEEVKEHWVQGERGTTMCHNAPLQDKKAPKAEPEEDIDVMECEYQESASINQENQEVVKGLEQVPKHISVAQLTQEKPEDPVDQCHDCFPPPPTPSTISTGDFCEKELFFSLQCEVTGVTGDVDVHSDTKEDLNSPDSQDSQEWPRTPQLLEPIDEEKDATSEEMTGEENITQLDVLLDDISKTEMNTSQPAHHFPSDSNASADVSTASSPLFADASEEEEEISLDFTSFEQLKNTLDVSSKIFLISDSSSNHADHSAKQQEVLLPQNPHEHSPRRGNQEAPQQVLSQGSPPLCSVAMELSNQDGAGSQCSGCVLAVRERHSRAEEDTEVKKEQTGGEKGQKEGRFRRFEPAGQPHSGGLLRYSQTVQVQKIKTDKHRCGVSLKHTRHTRMENDLCDESLSDSGVSADFSPYSTLEATTTISTGPPTTASKETPIEREIRRAIEREHSLRRSRGLPNPPTSPEYVDFPLKKSPLRQSITAKSERYQDKDREFAGKKMQHEIYEEAQREQDLVKLGKIPGFYDKGIDRHIKERKLIFEAFQAPSDSSFIISARSKAASSSSSSSDVSTLGKQEDSSSQSSTAGSSSEERRRSLDLQSPTPCLNSAEGGGISNSHPRGPGFSEGSGCQVIIFENNLSVPPQKHYHVKPETEAVTVVDSGYTLSSKTGGHHHHWLTERELEKEDEEEEEEIAPRENPFFKLRTSANLVKVKQDIQEAQEREKELRKQRISLYGGSGGAKGGRGLSTSVEGKSPVSSSLNGLAVLDIPESSLRVETGSSAVHQSVSKSFMWPPAQTEEERIYWRGSEVLQSPRTPRQKTPLVQRWESGLITRHNEEDD